MPPPIPVVLAEYDPEWPRMATNLAEGLQALGSSVVIVHHIGSTSVPGLAAKPIIDLMPLVTNLADLDRQRSRVEELGYEWYGELGIVGRRYCTLSNGAGTRIAQLHFFEADSPQAIRHIVFRDYLRVHPEMIRAYEGATLHPDDSHAYGDEKTAWIEQAEIKALAWFKDRQSTQ